MAFSVKAIKDSELDNILDNFIAELNVIFGIEWSKNNPSIFLVEDRKTIDLIKGEKTPDWFIGWSKDKDVFMLKKESWKSESCHTYSKKEYVMLLKHELTHSFCNVVFPWFQKPLWLREGIAIYLSGQHKTKKKPDRFEEFLGYIEKGGDRLYDESGFAVEILVECFGKDKLIELIKELRNIRSREELKALFREIYDFELSYKEFNKRLN